MSGFDPMDMPSSSFACGTCGSVVMRIKADPSGFTLSCGKGHDMVPVPGQEFIIVGMAADPIDECGQCGADLYLSVPHDCPVGGNIVTIEPR